MSVEHLSQPNLSQDTVEIVIAPRSLEDLDKQAVALETTTQSIEAKTDRCWSVLCRQGIPLDQLKVLHLEIYEIREELVTSAILPHIQQELEVLSEYYHAAIVAPQTKLLKRKDQIDSTIGGFNHRIDQLVHVSRVLLATDQATWDFVVEMRKHISRDRPLVKLFKKREDTPSLRGIEVNDVKLRKVASLTLQIIRRLVEKEVPVFLSPEDAFRFLSVRKLLERKLRIIDDIEFKAEQAKLINDIFAQQLASLYLTPARRILQAAQREASAKGADKEKLLPQLSTKLETMHADCVEFSNGYNISGTEIRELGWFSVVKILRSRGYTKTDVRNLVSVLNFTRNSIEANKNVLEVADSFVKTLEKESENIKTFKEFFVQSKEYLTTKQQAKAQQILARLHLNRTMGWLMEHHEEIDGLMEGILPNEWVVLKDIIKKYSGGESQLAK